MSDTTRPAHLCREAPMIRIIFSIAQCVRCRRLIDFTTDEVLADNSDEIRATRIGLSMLPSMETAGAKLDRIRPMDQP